MARIDKGNSLAEPKLAPGWKLSDDGFGLHTCQATYNVDVEAGFGFNRGEAFPISDYSYLKLHKQTSVFNKLGMQLQACDYVGIDPTMNGGEYTDPQVGSANGLTSENITAHPNFFVLADGFTEVIAGETYTQSDLGPVVTLVNSSGQKVSQKSWVGENGACFERETGGRFIGFVDPGFRSLFGKTQYLSPTTSFSGHVYVLETSAKIEAFKTCLGKTSSTPNWASQLMDLVPPYFGTTFTSSGGDQLLLAQVNFEDFASLVKVSFEIRFARYGWNEKVYAPAV